MDDRLYRFLTATAVVLTLAWLGWSVYDSYFAARGPGDADYIAANKLFEDGRYARAVAAYDDALAEAPDHVHAMRGKARALLQMQRYSAALAAFNRAIARAPDFGATYANRGILYDRMGRYQRALADYEKALRLNRELAEGPNWLTRFLRLQPEPPPTIADRADYLRRQLAKPESERLLEVPEEDAKQRPYKM